MAFLIGLFIGAVVTAVCFTIFYKNNLNHLAKARKALIDVYEQFGDKAEKVVKGVDKKVDKQIEEKKSS